MEIEINLNDLTPARLEECKPFMGKRDYGSPCIIGSLMTPNERAELVHWLELKERNTGRYLHEDYAKALIMAGTLIVPSGQQEDVQNLQEYFDNKDWESVLEIASKYMGTT
jgi:hypothetical protein